MKTIIKKLLSALKNGAADILVSSMLVKIFSLFSSIIVVRLLNKIEYGTLGYVENGYSYILLLSGLGLGNAILRYVPRMKTEVGRKSYLHFSLYGGLIAQACLIAIIIPIFCLLPIDFVYAKVLILLFILKPILAYVFETILNYIRAIEKNRLYAIISILFVLCNLVFLTAFTLLWGLNGVVVARYLAYIIPITFCILFLRKNLLHVENVPLERKESWDYFKFGFVLMVSSLLSSIMPVNDMMIVNLVLKNEIISANYKVALTIPLNLPFITNAILTYIYPKFAKNSDDKPWVWKNLCMVSVVTVGIMAFVCFLILILANPIVTLLYGEKYVEVVPFMRTLSIIISFNAAFRMLPMSLLPALGKVKLNLCVAGISCILQVVLDYIAISMFGLYGAALSLGFIYFITALVYWAYIYNVTHHEERSRKNEPG